MTLQPSVEGHADWSIYAGFLLGGLVVGSAGIVLLSPAARLLDVPVRVAFVAAVVVWSALGDFVPSLRRMPTARRQTPEWVALGGVGGRLQFGFEMGTGARTQSPTTLPHVVLVGVCLLQLSTVTIMLACLTFAASRGAVHSLIVTSRYPAATHDVVGRVANAKTASYAVVAVAIWAAVNATW